MNTKQQSRKDAIRATRGQLRHACIDPETANDYQIEAAANEVRPGFCGQASPAQWELFIKEFKKWQHGQKNEKHSVTHTI